jgi:hypothetical protein
MERHSTTILVSLLMVMGALGFVLTLLAIANPIPQA